MNSNYFLALLAVFMLMSCAIQKRKFQKGFYVSSSHKSTSRQRYLATPQKTETQELVVLKDMDTPLLAGANEFLMQSDSWGRLMHTTTISDSCDVLKFKDGRVMRVRIIETSLTGFKYKLCDGTSMQPYIVRKKEISSVKYHNPENEIIVPAESAADTITTHMNALTPVKKEIYEPNSIIALALSVVSLFFMFTASAGAVITAFLVFVVAIISLIFGIVSVVNISRQPEKYKGLALAILSLVLSVAILTYMTFIFTLIL